MGNSLKYKYSKRIDGIAHKTLLIAAFAGLTIFGASSAQSEENHVTGFAAELSTPTLDRLHAENSETYPNGSVYKYTDGSTANNYSMELKPEEMSSFDSVEWSKKGSSEKDFTFDTSTNTGSGVVSVSLPKYNGTSYSSTVGYYTYEYTAPSDYTVTGTRLNDNLTVDNVDRKIFTGISSGNNSGAIYNTKDLSTTSIISDFINNTTSYRAGAIYNSGSTGTITGNFIANKTAISGPYNMAYGGAIYNSGSTGVITGNFIKNYTRTRGGGYGGAIYNKSYSGEKANITSINADFIGNQVYGNNQTAPSSYEMSGGYAISSSVAGGGIYNGGNIGDIVGDFIGNNAWAEALDDGYNWGTLGAESYGGAIYNSDTINSITGDFINNSSYSDYIDGYGDCESKSDGGAIYNSGTIKVIKGDFINNSATAHGGWINYYSDAKAYGGAIYNSGNISTIEGNFSNNRIYSCFGMLDGDSKGGAIYNSGTIETIKGNFSNNKADNEGTTDGGAIYNSGTIGTIIGNFTNNLLDFLGNGAGIYNSGNITSITGDFIGNTSDSNGGAIYNIGTIDLIEGSFINNYGGHDNNYNHSESYVGGAIYTTSSLNFNSSNGRNSVFSGNTAFDFDSYSYPQAIFVDSNTATLTFNADENSSYTFDDYINGLAGYNVIFKGDNTGVVNLYNDIKKGAVTVAPDSETLTMNLANDTVHDYDIGSLNSNANSKWYIDVDIDNAKADRLITSIAGSTGLATLHGLNIISGDWTNINDENFKVQVLKTQDDSLQLALSDALQAEFDALDEIHVQKIMTADTYDAVNAETLWTDIYNKYTGTTTSDIYGIIGLTTTDTTNDSIGFIETRRSTTNDSTPTPLNTLTYVNQSDIGDRTFKSSSSSETYTVTENPGVTGSGEFSIIGKVNGDTRSTLDFSGHNGFELENSGTTLILQNLKVTGGQNIAISSKTDSIINLNNVDLSNNGTGITTAGNINVSGNSFVGDNITLTDKTGVISVDGTDNVTFDSTVTGVEYIVGGIYTNNKGLTYNSDTNMITSSSIYQNENGEYIYYNNKLTQIDGTNLYQCGSIIYNPDIDKTVGGESNTSMNIDLSNTTYTMTPVDGFDGVYRIKEIPYIYVSQLHRGLYYGGVYNNSYVYSNTTQITQKDGNYYNGTTLLTQIGGDTVRSDLNLINGEVTFTSNAQVADYNINLDNIKINLEKESSLDGNDLTVQSTSTLNTTNNATGEVALNIIDASNPLYWDLDINLVRNQADRISTAEASSGTITLDSLNIIRGYWTDITDPDFKIQILKTQDDNLQLALSDALQTEFNALDDIFTKKAVAITGEAYDSVNAETLWTDIYNKYTDGTIADIWGRIGLTTTDTTNDSIGFIETGRSLYSGTLRTPLNTLTYVNQSDIGDRTFKASSSSETYTVTENPGVTGAGEFSIIGRTDGETRSTLDFDGCKGFELNNADTTLTLQDLKVTGGQNIATSTKTDSIINLNNVDLSNNGTGITTAGNINVSGNSFIGDNITLTGKDGVLSVDGTDNVTFDSTVTGINKLANVDYYTNNRGTFYDPNTDKVISKTVYQNEDGDYVYTGYGVLTHIDGTSLYSNYSSHVIYSAETDQCMGIESYLSASGVTPDGNGNYILNGYKLTPREGFEGIYYNPSYRYSYDSHTNTVYDYAGVSNNTSEYSNGTYYYNNLTKNGDDYYFSGTLMTPVGGELYQTNLNLTDGEVTFTSNAQVTDNKINFDNVKVNLEKESSLDGNDLIVQSASTLNTQNNTIGEVALNIIDASNPLYFDLDIDLVNNQADTISTAEASSGTITLNSFNTINGSWADITDPDFKIQILKTQDDNLQLALNSTISGEIELGDSAEYLHHSDAINTVTNWDKKYYNHMYKDSTFGNINLATTDTTNDSIGVNITRQDSVESSQTLMGDTLALVNQANLPERSFTASSSDEVYKVGGDSAETVNIGTTAEGILNITGVADNEQRSTLDFQGNNGFTLGEDTTVNFKDIKVTGASQFAASNAESSVINLDNAEISGNDEGITTAGTINVTNGTIIDDDITLSGTNASLNIKNTNTAKLNAKVSGSNSTFSVTNSTLDITHQVSGVNTILDNSTLNIANESLLRGDLTVNTPSTINIVNNNIGTLNFNNVNLNNVLKMTVEADLANEIMDKITATNATVGTNGAIEVQKINLLSPTTKQELSLLFTNNLNLADAVTYTGEHEIVYSPIYKYITTYEKKDDGGYFKFAVPSKAGIGASSSGSPVYSDFNPAVLVAPVATQAAAQSTMNLGFNYAFEHAYSFSTLPEEVRTSKIRGNEVALSTDFDNNMDLNFEQDLDHTNRAVWVKPYTSFESMNLHNGPKVDMISYGTIIGSDSDFRKLKNGWANVGTLYIGYNGSQIDYNNVDMTTNGGMLGITETFYKKNFFTALTAQVGAGFAEAHTMYGKDDITSLMAGVASKTGYNFEFKEGKFVIQPNLMMSYSMVNTFDYKNSAGVKIDSDPLHTIQITPSIRFIGNLKNGWQPYASIGMVWNVMNESKVTANGVRLPESHTKPYVEYGIGIQKHFKETFSGYGQAMLRNGGRNGIALTAGFRWALPDKKSKKDNKSVNKDNSNNVSISIPTSVDSERKQKTAIKSISQNAKVRNLARYNELVGKI